MHQSNNGIVQAERLRCSNCRHYGHDARSCPREPRTALARTIYVPGTTTALLSRPSKMPGPSWSLPAGPACPFMQTGRGTICGSCYAKKGQYTADPKVRAAQWTRFDWARECMKSPAGIDLFVGVMIAAIAVAGDHEYMRVHDSGDLFSASYTRAWTRICAALPRVRFWFPTRSWRAPWVDAIRELAALPNVTVRPSAIFFGAEPPMIDGLHGGTTAKSFGYSCPAAQQDNSCGSCRQCWTDKTAEISYHAHFMGPQGGQVQAPIVRRFVASPSGLVAIS